MIGEILKNECCSCASVTGCVPVDLPSCNEKSYIKSDSLQGVIAAAAAAAVINC